jgi:glycosyltransferase involved in cell wall biosynthesis
MKIKFFKICFGFLLLFSAWTIIATAIDRYVPLTKSKPAESTNDRVSVIIPTYNRFDLLLEAIKSAANQTHTNLEIIVVNDSSSEEAYYSYDFSSLVKEQGPHAPSLKIIHLPTNTKQLFGYACAGYVRNVGIKNSSGKYIAFLDDDDIWFPTKIERQLKAMQASNCKMSSTEGLIGYGKYDPLQHYKKYNSEHYHEILKGIYASAGSNALDHGFPDIWNLEFIQIHNCIICSSVLMEREMIEQIGLMKNVYNGQEDYDYWLRLLTITNSAYVNETLF